MYVLVTQAWRLVSDTLAEGCWLEIWCCSQTLLVSALVDSRLPWSPGGRHQLACKHSPPSAPSAVMKLKVCNINQKQRF